MFYVYALISKKAPGWFYVGFSADLKKRLERHNSGKVKSTSSRVPFLLVYYEAYRSEGDARAREKNLKTHQQRNFLKARIKDSLKEINSAR